MSSPLPQVNVGIKCLYMLLTNCPSLKRLLSGEQNKGKFMS